MKKIVFVRHPESEANIAKITGSSDVDLSVYGAQTALCFAKHHKDELFVTNPLILSGTQLRSQRLVDVLQDVHPGLCVVTSADCNERRFGILGGRTKQEIVEVLQGMYPEYADDHNFSSWMARKIALPGGFESNAALQLRIKWLLHKTIEQYPTYNTIRCITSTGVKRNALSSGLQQDAQQIDAILPNNKVPNLSRTVMMYTPETGKFSDVKEIAYIDPVLQTQFDDIRKKHP